MDMGIPRNEYPRPQMRRENWINLNGIWEFAFDFGRTGKERGMQNASKLSREILVPFCPESVLSGIHYPDFMNAVWYRRCFVLDDLSNGNRVLLHFEAVDHFCTVYLNGTELGSHTGGFTPFSFDITGQVRPGENVLTVCAEDDSRDPLIPRGKQSEPYASQGCDYTRVTGIWQTVWLEIVPETYLADYRVTTDIDNGTASFALHFNRTGSKQVAVQVLYQGEPMGDARLRCTGDRLCFTVPLKETHLWEVGKGRLYDVLFTVTDANGHEDHVSGYFGMRSVTLSEKALCLNGKPLFQRLVLDQGFYPDGIYTAPSDEALREDILCSMALGFQGARLHQKVFERRFLYWADRLGYLVWGEYGNWGLDHSNPAALGAMLTPWLEAVARDFNAPSVIGWCPFNETWDYKGRHQEDSVILSVYKATKALDPTRPVIDTSGNYHTQTDLYDVHDYEQDVDAFAAHYALMEAGGPVYDWCGRQHYGGQPYWVSEYGGILWDSHQEGGWGYGRGPESPEEYVQRFVGLTRVLMKNPKICGLCYTQLYDVEQEKNGIYTYNRQPKFTRAQMEQMHQALCVPAAIEEAP